MHDHAVVETQDHLAALKNRKRFDANIPAASWGVGSRFWKFLTFLCLSRVRMSRRFTVKKIYALKK